MSQLDNTISRKEQRKNDPTFQAAQIASVDALSAADIDESKTFNEEVRNYNSFNQDIKNFLESVSFPIQRDQIIEKAKQGIKNSSLLTFMENIPNKKYNTRDEIFEIIK